MDWKVFPTETERLMKYHEIKFKTLKEEIRNCKSYQAISFNSTDLQPNDVCIRRRKCYKQVIKVNFDMKLKQNVFMKIDCPCDGKHSYECNRHFCTNSNKSCDILNRIESPQVAMEIEKCLFMNF